MQQILKDIMIKFIDQNRRGKECILDLKIGSIFANSNGEIQFHNLKQFSRIETEIDEEVAQKNQENNRY